MSTETLLYGKRQPHCNDPKAFDELPREGLQGLGWGLMRVTTSVEGWTCP